MLQIRIEIGRGRVLALSDTTLRVDYYNDYVDYVEWRAREHDLVLHRVGKPARVFVGGYPEYWEKGKLIRTV